MIKNSKNKILSKVQNALQNNMREVEKGEAAINRLEKQVQTARLADTKQLIERFSKEVELVNGICHGPITYKDAEDSIAELCVNNGYKKLAISAENEVRSIAVNVNLKCQVQIVQTWKNEWPDRKMETAHISVSLFKASYAVAEIGQLILLYDQSQTTMPHFLCDHSLVLLPINNIFFDQFQLFEEIQAEQVKNMVFITGPSRTADIEKVLVLGAHGPRKLDVFLID